MIDVSIDIGDLKKKLNRLPKRIRKNVLDGAVRAGARPIVEEARRRVPKRTRNLEKSIGVNKRRSKDPYVIIFSVSPRVGGKYNGYYGLFVERGHPIVKGGKVVGYAPAKPFMRPAFDFSIKREGQPWNSHKMETLP